MLAAIYRIQQLFFRRSWQRTRNLILRSLRCILSKLVPQEIPEVRVQHKNNPEKWDNIHYKNKIWFMVTGSCTGIRISSSRSIRSRTPIALSLKLQQTGRLTCFKGFMRTATDTTLLVPTLTESQSQGVCGSRFPYPLSKNVDNWCTARLVQL